MAKKDSNHAPRLKYMILSVVIAIIIWILVSFSTGVDITNTFHNVPVRYTGMRELSSRELVLLRSAPAADLAVTLTGKRTDIMDALDNVQIEVDVSEITEAGDYELEGTVRLPSSKLTIERTNFTTVPVTVSAMTEKEIPLEVRYDTFNKKYVNAVPDQEKVVIMGAESELAGIDKAFLFVTAPKGEPTDGEVLMPVRYEDSAGRELRLPDSVRCRTPQVKVKCTVYDAVMLPVDIDTTIIERDGYKVDRDKTVIEPKEIEVGVLPRSKIEHVLARVEKADSNTPMDCEIMNTAGLFVPDKSKTVRVTLSAYDSSNEMD